MVLNFQKEPRRLAAQVIFVNDEGGNSGPDPGIWLHEGFVLRRLLQGLPRCAVTLLHLQPVAPHDDQQVNVASLLPLSPGYRAIEGYGQ